MVLRGHKEGALVQLDLRFLGLRHLVGLLAVDADGGHRHSLPSQPQLLQQIIERHRLTGIFGHTGDGEGFAFQYVIY